MSGDMFRRWLLLGEVLTEEQLESLIEVAEQLVDPLAVGSMEFDAVRKTDEKQLTERPLVSKSYEHDGIAEVNRQSD
jgi:hypothetical protein